MMHDGKQDDGEHETGSQSFSRSLLIKLTFKKKCDSDAHLKGFFLGQSSNVVLFKFSRDLLIDKPHFHFVVFDKLLRSLRD